MTFLLQSKYKLRYKARDITGTAIHVAALHLSPCFPTCVDILSWLLEVQADLDEPCHFVSQGKQGRMMAIHLAAGRGNMQMMKELLKANVDVNRKTYIKGVDSAGKPKDRENYTALHEACFFSNSDVQSAMVEELIKQRADVNAENIDRQTPLHIAAKQGGDANCQQLAEAGAQLDKLDKKYNTALDLAMESGRYAPHKLFHLTGRTLFDLLKVARLSPKGATELIRNYTSRKIEECWTARLSEEMLNPETRAEALKNWIDLMMIAPSAGSDVIEALTVPPRVRDQSHHSLPSRVSLPTGSSYLCQYVQDKVWEYDSESNPQTPAWHSELCPGFQEDIRRPRSHSRPKGFQRWCRYLYGKLTGQGDGAHALPRLQSLSNEIGEAMNASTETNRNNVGAAGFQETKHRNLIPVKVVMIRLPGIICPEVLHVLSSVKDRQIFAKIGVRAIVDFVWDSVVKWHYYSKTLIRIVVLIVLMCWVLGLIPPGICLQRKVSWSLVAVGTYLELFYEVLEAIGYIVKLKKPHSYFSSVKNLGDYASSALGLALVHLSHINYRLEDWPIFLCIVVMGRWVMLTWTCRAFAWAGQKILPILQASFAPMAGIILVTFFVFFGFWHSFAALTLGPAEHGADIQYQVVVSSLRMLVLGDGDGLNFILALYDGEEDGHWITFMFFCVAVFFFCICLLNLFIAVHGEAYDKAQETAAVSFQQERAAICLHCLLMPTWPPRGWDRLYFSRNKSIALLLYVVTIAGWYVLLWGDVPPWIASLVLLLGCLFADSMLSQLPWCKASKTPEQLFATAYKEAISISVKDYVHIDRDKGTKAENWIKQFAEDNHMKTEADDLLERLQRQAAHLGVATEEKKEAAALAQDKFHAYCIAARNYLQDWGMGSFYFWICHSIAEDDDNSFGRAEDTDGSMQGRNASVKKAAMEYNEKLQHSLRSLKDKVCHKQTGIEQALNEMDQKFNELEQIVENAHKELLAASALGTVRSAVILE